MRYIIGTALVAALIAAPGLAFAETRSYELDAFTRIDISSGIDAIVTVGGAQSIRAESPRKEDIDDLKVEVKGGTLKVWTDWDLLSLFEFGETGTRLFVTVPALDGAAASSGADVQITGLAADAVKLNSSSGADLTAHNVVGKTYDLNASSGADLTVDGTCTSAKMNASSGASLSAGKLLCTDIDINVSSGSDADISATGSLKANASSGADINVAGKPAQVDSEESSGGGVEIAN